MKEIIAISLFIAIIAQEELNIGSRIKLYLQIRLSKNVKILDCLPCLAFWISVVLSFCFDISFISCIFTFLIAKFYDRKN